MSYAAAIDHEVAENETSTLIFVSAYNGGNVSSSQNVWKQSSVGPSIFFILPLAGLTLVANAVTCIEISRDKCLRCRKLYAYLASMALCDAFIAAVVEPLAVAKAYSGQLPPIYCYFLYSSVNSHDINS